MFYTLQCQWYFGGPWNGAEALRSALGINSLAQLLTPILPKSQDLGRSLNRTEALFRRL